MLKLKFNFQDVLRAPRLAFSLQRMWIQLVGLFFGYLGYLVFTYLSFLSNGFDLAVMWQRYGLFPCAFTGGDTLAWYSLILAIIGVLALFIAFLLTNTAVSRAVYMSAKGNTFYTWRESFAFAFRKLASVLLTPISLMILVGLLVLGALVIGLLGKIPFIGEIGVSLFTVFWFLAALFLFFVAIVAAITLLYAPSILATTDEDAFEAVFQSFSMTWSQPWRMIFYQALTLVLSVLALGIFAAFVKEAIVIMNMLFAWFMGADFINLANNGQAMLQSWTLLAQDAVNFLFQDYQHLVYFTREFSLIPVESLSVSVVIASWLYALSLLFLGGWVVSYGLSTFSACNTISYIVIRQKKDEENLLERVDKEEEEEEDEEEIEETPAEPESAEESNESSEKRI
ncbi:MAG: hypothetical protein U5R06_10290 [candidate division KSB1 bacterium]|nr:hypothetical protein [candidate division KSB1 bacterium]